MRGPETDISKIHALKGVLIYEIMGFLFIIAICWVTELYDPPFSQSQIIIETISIIIVGCITVYLTWQLIKKIKYLEGFMVICASCKRVREADDKWVSLEEIISRKSDLQFSHGVCPECAEKLYGEYL
jgi:ABC-type nickel/cobalt efflux system permease component RcnA